MIQHEKWHFAEISANNALFCVDIHKIVSNLTNFSWCSKRRTFVTILKFWNQPLKNHFMNDFRHFINIFSKAIRRWLEISTYYRVNFYKMKYNNMVIFFRDLTLSWNKVWIQPNWILYWISIRSIIPEMRL